MTRRLGWLAMGIALAGLIRDASLHLWREPSLRGVPTTRIDPRYAGVLPELQGVDRLCWRTDLPREDERAGRRYFDSLYALAPRVLVPDDASSRLCLFDPAVGLPRLERR